VRSEARENRFALRLENMAYDRESIRFFRCDERKVEQVARGELVAAVPRRRPN